VNVNVKFTEVPVIIDRNLEAFSSLFQDYDQSVLSGNSLLRREFVRKKDVNFLFTFANCSLLNLFASS
jgi:hypothetical protein